MVIVDAPSLLNWMFYGYSKANEQDKITASDAVMNYIDKIKRHTNQFVVVVLDRSRETTFRRRLYPEYKANREETPVELQEEKKNLIYKLTQNKIPYFESPEYEGDDFAGTLAKRYSISECVFLVTKDQDYTQLVGTNIYLWLIKDEPEKIKNLQKKYGIQPMQKFFPKMYQFDERLVKEEYGVYPKQIPDLKGIAGDNSDNIPGVKGIGKSILPLLQHYGCIEDMYLEMSCLPESIIINHWKNDLNIKRAKHQYELLRDQKDNAFLSKKLATIVCDVPINA